MTPRQIWKQHCKTAREILAKSGVTEALDYLVGQKLMEFWERSETDPAYKKELQAFICECWSVFGEREFNHYFNHLELTTPMWVGDPNDQDTGEMPDLEQQKKLDFFERAKLWLLRN